MDDIGKTVLVVEIENNQAYQLYVCISRSNGGGFDEQVEVKDNCVNYYPIYVCRRWKTWVYPQAKVFFSFGVICVSGGYMH